MKKSKTPEEQAAEETWYILQKIHAEELVTPPFDESEPFQRYSRYTPIGINVTFGGIYAPGIPDQMRTQKIMSKLEAEGLIRIGSEFHDDIGTGSAYTIRLNKDKFDELYKKYQEQLNIESTERGDEPLIPKFHFDQGVLHRDGVKDVEIFGEKTLEHTALTAAFTVPFGDRIDNATYPIDCGWEKLYDAARRINEKIANRYGIKDFFHIDYPNKFIKRNVN